VVVSSPLLRARQTAAFVARATSAELRVDTRLSPGAGVAELRAVLEELGGPAATVGHQPDCSEIAVALTGSDPGFPPAGVATIELEP
jgi:phosphohistidine phosphatase SixA